MLSRQAIFAFALSLAAVSAVAVARVPVGPTIPVRQVPIVRPRPTMAPPPLPAIAAPALSSTIIVPLAKLPPLPPPPGGASAIRHVRSATGATINVTTQSGCGTTVGTIFNLNCQVQWQAQTLPAGTHQDFVILANASTASAVGGTYTTATGTAHSQTLSTAGTYIFASLNQTTQQWDAIVYVVSQSAPAFGTFSDSTHKVATSQFVANSSTTVFVYATGLSQTDSYVVYAESTSITGACVFIAPPASPTPAPGQLCNAANSSGQNAVGGAIDVAWTLSSSLPSGTYSIVIYDRTSGTQLAQRQIALTAQGTSSAWSIVPTGGNPSPNPQPAATAGARFAFDGTNDKSDTSLRASVTGLTANGQYQEVVSDPNGAVVFSQGQNADNTGSLSVQWNFTQAQSPQNYVGNAYTLSLLSKTTNTVVTTSGFSILGYYLQSQFTNPVGTALSINSGTATSGIQFTNASDSFFGSGNGDAFSELEYTTGTQGITATLGPTSTSCGANCQTETVSDTIGGSWTVTDTCTTNGNNAGCNIILVPLSAGQTLPVGASVTVPSITFTNPPGSHCSNGCTTSTSELPADGQTWSNVSDVSGGNTLDLTNGFGNTYAASGHVVLVGSTTGGAITANQEAHGFAPNFTHAIYAQTQPFTSIGGTRDVFGYTITNASSVGSGAITALQLAFPSAFTVSTATVDAASPSAWSVQSCPNGTPSNVLCLQKNGANNGIADNGGTETIYIDITPPSLAFSYTDISAQATSPAIFPVTADGSATVFVGTSNPQVVDSTAVGSYSLNSSLLTPQFAPQTVGTNTNSSVSISLQNTPSGSDPFPDYLDAVVIDLPNADPLTNVANVTAGWSFAGTSAPTGSTTRYWFVLCAAQFSTANGPAANPPPPLSASLPSCGSSTEQSALAPGGTVSFTANVQVGTSSVSATAYAHGANGDGWSTSRAFTLNVTPIAATGGFSQVGAYQSPTTLSANTIPQIGADSDPTFGNTFVYEITNTSGTGNNITSATITIPGTDTSGANGTDSGNVPWTITATPTLGGSGGTTGCSVTSFSSATTAGANGSIVIGGGGCTIPPNGKLDVTFSAKAPYRVGTSYQFPLVVNGNVSASAPWLDDNDVQIVLTASLAVVVNPSNPGPGGSAPSVTCSLSPCTFSPGVVDFGSIANAQTQTGQDVVRVSVSTDAATLDPWQLFISTNNNPTNTGSPTNELLSMVDQTASNQGGTGLHVDQTAFAVIPTSGTGAELVDTGSGAAARRLPYDVIADLRVSIQGGSLGAQSSTIVFTFIAN